MSQFKIGDRVRITKRVRKEEGWANDWTCGMDESIGKVFEVEAISSDFGIRIGVWHFPPSSLELVSRKSIDDATPAEWDASATAVRRVMPAGAVGDVNSTARGTGARFNAGKAPLDLIPLSILAASYGSPEGRVNGGAVKALENLGKWQETGVEEFLYSALRSLGDDYWTDCAKVFEYGKAKYAPWNWAKGMAWSIPLACAARHLRAVIEDNEMDDKESKLPHRGHAACNIVMLLTFLKNYPEGDDRPRMLGVQPC